MPGSEWRGGRAFWLPLTAECEAWGEAEAPMELKKGFVCREGSGVLCALDIGFMACGCERARCVPCSGEAA